MKIDLGKNTHSLFLPPGIFSAPIPHPSRALGHRPVAGGKFFGSMEDRFTRAGKMVDKQFDHLRGGRGGGALEVGLLRIPP